jgi:DNA-binding NarL/FixJ family response regulator
MSYLVLIVDDHPLFRAALRDAVRAVCDDCEFLEAGSIASLFDQLETHPDADLLLLDLNLPGAYGFCALAHLRGSHPELPVVVISALDDRRTVRQALAFGAQDFISKSANAERIGCGLRSILQGENTPTSGLATNAALEVGGPALEVAQRIAQLTTQQFRVFGMLCAGKLNKQIAHELNIAETTVKVHMTAILRKLRAANRTQAALLARHLLTNPSELRPVPDATET